MSGWTRGRRLAVGVAIATALATVGVLASSADRSRPVAELRGETLPYRLPLPPTGWFERPRSVLRQEAPDGTLAWLERPDVPMDLLVIADLGTDHEDTTFEDLEDRALIDLEKAAEDGVEVVQRIDLPRGRITEMRSRTLDGEVRTVLGLFLVPGVGYRLTAAVAEANYEDVADELHDVLRGFDPGQ